MNTAVIKNRVNHIGMYSIYFFLLLIASKNFGQEISSAAKVFPEIITTQDSVFFIAVVVHVTSACPIIGVEINQIGDSIIVKSCTFYGDAGSPCGYRDTFFLGSQFQEKKYKVTYIASFTHGSNNNDTLCLTSLNNPALHDTAYYSFTVLPTTSTHEPASRSNVMISPNPTASTLHLIFDSPPKSPLKAQVLDVNGRLRKELVLPAGSEPEVDVSGLLPGLYFLKLADSQGQAEMLKFVRQ